MCLNAATNRKKPIFSSCESALPLLQVTAGASCTTKSHVVSSILFTLPLLFILFALLFFLLPPSPLHCSSLKSGAASALFPSELVIAERECWLQTDACHFKTHATRVCRRRPMQNAGNMQVGESFCSRNLSTSGYFCFIVGSLQH